MKPFPWISLGLFLSFCGLAGAAQPTKLACVGDSITFGAGTTAPSWYSYPSQLQRMLGDKWEVRNFGNSGSTLLNSGDKPYQKENSFSDALKFEPDVVVIMLGTNDTKPQNWRYKDKFAADYKDLIGKFKALKTRPRIYVGLPAYVSGDGNWGINEKGVLEEIPLIKQIAAEEKATVIDVHGATNRKDELFPDRVHPNNDGATVLAKTVYEGLTGKPFSGRVPTAFKSEWAGYERLDFLWDDRPCILVSPKSAASGKPWIWRTEFFGAFPSVDIALLKKGYHVTYMSMPGLFGAPSAMKLMDKYYDYVTREFGLSRETVLEGFSRGGLYAFNWAALNPGKVGAIYVDAPVCDFKSWPGGKGRGPGSPGDWEQCLKAYGFTEEQALAYELNPVDNLKPIADAKIPIIAVAGGADELLPVEENIEIVEKRYKELGGQIDVIIKPGGLHHPHSLEDPAPVVNFLLKHNK